MKMLCAVFLIVTLIFPAAAQTAPPTATEIFHLRTECAALADKMTHEFEEMQLMVPIPKTIRSPETYETHSHYDPTTNRCYADITSFYSTAPVSNGHYLQDSREPWVEHRHRALYDAQTKDVLASSSIDGDKRVGSVFEEGHQKYFADANASFDDATDYIDAKMADDRKR